MNDLIRTPWGPNSPSNHLDRTSPLFDAFGRLRVATLETLFDSKLSYGKLPILWDEVVSANASSTHVEVGSCVNLAVTANNAYAIRQTRQRWNYQPGKGQLLLCTFKMPTAASVAARVGLMHGNSTARMRYTTACSLRSRMAWRLSTSARGPSRAASSPRRG